MFILLSILACTSEIDNKQAAQVKDVSEKKAESPKVAPKTEAGTKPADTKKGITLSFANTSTVEWVGAKVTGDHSGGFKVVKGTAQIDGDALLSLNAEIDIASMFSDSDRLTGHLLSKDFFEAQKYPTAVFSSTKIEDGTITGILDMRMVKKEISFPAKIVVQDQAVDIQSEFTINRRLWGINYDGKANNLIKDDVLIKLNVQYK
jgi:polyisoprenoid-binding protein YceI